jgi:hypothetical protein
VNGLVVTFTYPKNSGLGSEDVLFIVSDGKAITSIGKRVTVLGPFTVTTPPDMEAIEGTRAVLDVSGNIHDPQAKALTITTNSKFVTVNGTSLELLYPVGSGVSIDTVRVTVSDGTSGNDTSVSFKVRVTAVFPTISIGEPSNGSEVSGKVKISGTASISSGQVTRVEVRVDNGDWVVANGIASWSLDLDTKDLKNGFHYITARALSNNVSSQEVGVDIDVKNSGPETMTAGNLLAIGIMIGLIIAVVIGVIGYVIGRGKRRPRPPEEGHRPARQGRERRGPDRELEEGSADTEAPDKDMGHGFDPVPEPGPMHDLETDHALQDTGSEAEIADSQETDLGPDAGARTGPEDADVEPHGPPEAEKPGIGDWTAESEMMAEEDAVDRSSSEGDHDGMDGGHEKDAKKEKVEDTLDDILSKLQ